MSALNWIQAVGTIATTVGLAAGGIWAYVRLRKRREHIPRTVVECDIEFASRHGDYLVLMLVLKITNPSLVQWEAANFDFELRYALPGDDLDEEDPQYGLQLPRKALKGSWLGEYESILVEPDTYGQYQRVVRVPGNASLFQLVNTSSIIGPDGSTETDTEVVLAVPPATAE